MRKSILASVCLSTTLGMAGMAGAQVDDGSFQQPLSDPYALQQHYPYYVDVYGYLHTPEGLFYVGPPQHWEPPPSGSEPWQQPLTGSYQLEQPLIGSYQLEQPLIGSYQLEQPLIGSYQLQQPMAGSDQLRQPPRRR